jgi:uncharacterized metal-binding protein
MADQCCSSANVILLACSGGSNVGQITNEAAKRLDQEGLGKFFCLAGVGGAIRGMLANVEGADRVIVLDGCPVACARAVLDTAGIAIDHYVMATDCGIEKEHHFDLTPGQIEKVCAAARSAEWIKEAGE